MEKIIIDGIAMYTSDELKEKLKDFINKSGSTRSKGILIQLIDDGVIIPIINEQNILRKLLMKIRKQRPIDYLFGFAANGKCYVIFLPHHTTQDLVDTALHESLHVAHRQFPEKFTQLNMSIYLDFYSYFYKELFKADNYNPKYFSIFIENLAYKGWFQGDLLYSAFKDYTKLSINQIQEAFGQVLYVYRKDFNYSNFSFHIKMLLNAAYREVFNNIDHQVGVYQEIYNPAEIICVLSTIHPEHPNVIKSLKLIVPDRKPATDSLPKKLMKGKFIY